jgi:hypothetical protein
VVAWWCGKEKGEKREARKIAVLRKLGLLLIVAYYKSFIGHYGGKPISITTPL